ncbi:hypothetical protein [Microcoleus sp. Pol17_C1]
MTILSAYERENGAERSDDQQPTETKPAAVAKAKRGFAYKR